LIINNKLKDKTMIDLRKNNQTIKQLVDLGLTNYYTSSPLHIQRLALLQDAKRKNLIKINL